jgi:hypothetical protein
MANRDRIEERIDKKTQEIQELEMKIREAKAYLQALQDIAKLMPRDDEEEPAEEGMPSGRSYITDAKDAITKAGRALHIVEIIKMSGRKNDRKTRTGFSGSLAAYVRKGEIFTRPKPNTFGLIELKAPAAPPQAAAKPTPAPQTPPPNFGSPDSLEDDIPF